MDVNDPHTWPAAARAYYARRRGAPGESPLLPLLRARIRAEGPLPFARFMELALYHPEHGYYLQPVPPVGREGDFVTAPEHHPAFSRLVGRRVRAVAAGIGEGFTVVEMGAGTGALARGILEELAAGEPGPGGVEARYRIVEPFAVWRRRQQETLEGHLDRVEWIDGLEQCPPFRGMFLSNELADAFPFHRVVRREDGLAELRVDAAADELVEVEGPLSTPDLARYFHALKLLPAPDRVVEVSLHLAPWARRVAALLREGSFLTLDYGGTARELFLEGGPGGSLRSYRDHAATDPLRDPGRQDLTASVDFTTLIWTGEAAGLRLHAFTTQRQFLLAMGWAEWLRRAGTGGRRALSDLVDPRQMGRTRVLELTRART